MSYRRRSSLMLAAVGGSVRSSKKGPERRSGACRSRSNWTDCTEKLQSAVCPGVIPRDACLKPNVCFVQQVSFELWASDLQIVPYASAPTAWLTARRNCFVLAYTPGILRVFCSDGFPYVIASAFSTPAFSAPAFSIPAVYSCFFHSCIFHSRIFSAPD